jgi:shikimate dehydrogenase
MTMSLAGIQAAITNRLPDVDTELVAGIIGDRPSQSAKSPSIWNPTFASLELPVVYLPFDVDAAGLERLVDALRASPHFIGGNVTMPHKVAVLPLLDEVDERARAIGAVNTIVRTAAGRLAGYNTDGKGGVDALSQAPAGQADARPLVPDLGGRKVLVMGAGGAGRALAVYLGEAIGPEGALHIANRTVAQADAVVEAVNRRSSNCRRVDEIAPAQYDLVVNASTVGQAGVRSLPDGRVTCLEPFSPLAAAEAPAMDRSEAADVEHFARRWMSLAAGAVGRNNAASLEALTETPETVACYDVIFAPLETTFLRQARQTGHRTLNGRAMSVAQAADGFFNRVCRDLLDRRGLWRPDVYDRIVNTMSSVW